MLFGIFLIYVKHLCKVSGPGVITVSTIRERKFNNGNISCENYETRSKHIFHQVAVKWPRGIRAAFPEAFRPCFISCWSPPPPPHPRPHTRVRHCMQQCVSKTTVVRNNILLQTKQHEKLFRTNTEHVPKQIMNKFRNSPEQC